MNLLLSIDVLILLFALTLGSYSKQRSSATIPVLVPVNERRRPRS